MKKLYFSRDLTDYELTGKEVTCRDEKKNSVRTMAILWDWRKITVAKMQVPSRDGCEAK